MAEIHPQLCKDCLVLGRFPLSYLLLMNNSHYPWLILVPDRDAVTEIYHLCERDQQQLWQESAHLSAQLMKQLDGDKLNVAAIGNIVSQLHLHHVVRYRSDAVWPAPVWGKLPAIAYSDDSLAKLIKRLDLKSLANFTLPVMVNCQSRQ